MKLAKIYLSLLALGLTIFSSCEDFLQEEPIGKLTVESAYNTTDDLIKASNGLYSNFVALYRIGNQDMNILSIGESRSDDLRSPVDYTSVNDSYNMDKYLFTTTSAGPRALWSTAYQAIRDCNVILERAPISQADSATKVLVMAQAKFFRAYWYFVLVRFYGDVPLVTKTFTNANDALLPRTPLATVYDTIINDMEFCVNPKKGLQEKYSDLGRITLGAARTALAEVYMTRPSADKTSDYLKAKNYLSKVWQSGYYALFPNYADPFKFANKYSPIGSAALGEAVWMVNMDNDVDPPGSNKIAQFYNPRNAQVTVPGLQIQRNGNGALVATPQLYGLYEPGDLRRDVTFPATYINNAGAILNFPHNSNPATGGYYINKFTLEGQGTGVAYHNTKNPVFVYRFADVLLLYAEAANEVGKTPTDSAKMAINLIRKRAFGAVRDLDPNLNYAQFKDAVIKEARIELVGEGRRFYYEMRLGTLVSDLLAINQVIDPNKALFPIPDGEMKVNRKLVQNPGY